jgi:hypothetical protein
MQSNSYSVPGDDRLDGCSLFSFGDELTVFTKTAAPRARERFLKVLRFHQSCAAQPLWTDAQIAVQPARSNDGRTIAIFEIQP